MLEKFKRFVRNMVGSWVPKEPEVEFVEFSTLLTPLGRRHAEKKTAELIKLLRKELRVAGGVLDVRQKVRAANTSGDFSFTPPLIVISLDGGRGKPIEFASIKVGYTPNLEPLYHLMQDKGGEEFCCEDRHRLVLAGKIQAMISALETELSNSRVT